MTLQRNISVIAVLVASSVSLAAEPTRLPKGVPPLAGEAVVREIEGDRSRSEWTIALTMRTETWHAIRGEMPDLRWPKIEETVRSGSVYEGTMTLRMGEQSQPAFCRVVDMSGKELGRDQLVNQLKRKRPVLVAVTGQMPHPCCLRLPTPANLIVLLGPEDDQNARRKPSPVASGADTADSKANPEAQATDDSRRDLKDWGERESQQYFFTLMQKARNFQIATEEEASKYLRGIWRLDKRAHIGGGHYVRADRGDDVTVICNDEWLVKTDFNLKNKKVVQSVTRITKIALGPDGSLKVNGSERFRPLDDDRMAVLAYDYIAIVQRITCESNTNR
jgi:hypothetical protein